MAQHRRHGSAFTKAAAFALTGAALSGIFIAAKQMMIPGFTASVAARPHPAGCFVSVSYGPQITCEPPRIRQAKAKPVNLPCPHSMNPGASGADMAVAENPTPVSLLFRYQFKNRPLSRMSLPMANDADRTFEKWGETARAGFQTVPDLLLKKQVDLGLSATDMMVMLNITMHWWYKDQRAFPHTSTICSRMGMDERTVQISVKKLISLKLMEKVKESDGKGGERTVCDFTGLIERLGQFVGDDKDYMARKRRQAMVEASSFNMEL